LALGELVSHALSSLEPQGFCYPSSGAVYGDPRSDPVLDYARQKVADEAAFRERCAAVGARIVIPRVFSVGGPCNPDPERYLLGELVQRTLADLPLLLRSPNRVYRSYVSLTDVLAVVLTELLNGKHRELIFDASGTETVEAAELAQRVREVLGRPNLPILRQESRTVTGDPRLEDDHYVGDPTALRSIASEWDYPLAPLNEVIRQSALA
jgi:nucleoside-diphosphate-sugar epimerase